MRKVVGIDVGHIDDPVYTGAFANGLAERDLNMEVYKRLRPIIINDYGFKVISVYGPLQDRYSWYNKNLPSNDYLLCSIHHDGNTNTSINGTMALCSAYSTSRTIEHAKYWVNEMCKACGFKNRGLLQRKGSNGRDYYGIIRETKPIVILGEAAVLTNYSNAKYIKENKEKFINSQVQAYVKLICKWYNVKYKGTNNTPVKKNYEDILKEVSKWSNVYLEDLKTIHKEGHNWKGLIEKLYYTNPK